MKMLFRFLTAVMFLCLLSIAGMYERGFFGFGIGIVMVLVAGVGMIGCAYLGGLTKEYKEEE